MNILGFRCVQCQGQLQISTHGLCSRCYREIRRFAYCGKCGAELPHNAMLCGQCLRNEPSWDRLVMVGRYNEPLSLLIHRFKFQNQFWLDRTLARLLLLAIRHAKCVHGLILPEVILPVPLHHIRQWQRGYNQADLLACWLSKWLHIPMQNQLLQRHKRTPTQRGLTAKARRQNLKNAFSATKPFPYQRVALVDDVLTTGSTVNEIAKLLRKIGVQEIQIWCLART